MNVQTKIGNTTLNPVELRAEALKIGFVGLGKLGQDVSEVFGEFYNP